MVGRELVGSSVASNCGEARACLSWDICGIFLVAEAFAGPVLIQPLHKQGTSISAKLYRLRRAIGLCCRAEADRRRIFLCYAIRNLLSAVCLVSSAIPLTSGVVSASPLPVFCLG